MIPCKDCLVRATCRERDHIICNSLYEWMNTTKDISDIVTEYHPNWLSIRHKEPPGFFINKRD